MGHSHDHDHGTYYIEQLCTIGVCGAVAGVCIMMWWAQNYSPAPEPPRRHMLEVMLKPTFHWPVLAGGIALVVLVLIRAVAVWVSVGRSNATVAHDHDHDHHHHDHDHAHEHGHDHAHDHAHEHVHDHAHEPDLDEADHGHDHGFSPWRYMVLLVPVILFFLGIPNKPPSEKAVDPNDFVPDTRTQQRPIFGMRVARTAAGDLEVTKVKPNSAPYEAGLRGGEVIKELRHEVDKDGQPLPKTRVIKPRSLESLADVGKVFQEENMDRITLVVASENGGPTRHVDLDRNSALLLNFSELEQAGYRKEDRDWYQGRMGRLRGQFTPMMNDRQFTLVRLKMACCAADAVPLKAMIVAKDPINHVKAQDWVDVEGQIYFLESRGRKGEFMPVLKVLSNEKIRKIPPEPSLYLQ